jgi:hypothetical protein
MEFAAAAVIIYAIVMLAIFFVPTKLFSKKYYTRGMGFSETEYKSRTAKFAHRLGFAKIVGVILVLVLFLIKIAFFS